MSAVLDRFIPCPDEGKHHEITIEAPAGLVLQVAQNFDMQSIEMVRILFGLQSKLLSATWWPLTSRVGAREVTPLLAHVRHWHCDDPSASVARDSSPGKAAMALIGPFYVREPMNVTRSYSEPGHLNEGYRSMSVIQSCEICYISLSCFR
jgi:hypothetical protein